MQFDGVLSKRADVIEELLEHVHRAVCRAGIMTRTPPVEAVKGGGRAIESCCGFTAFPVSTSGKY